MQTDRLNHVRNSLDPNGIDALLIGSAGNRRYVSGFSGSAGWALISPERALLAVDFRYVEQAKQQAVDFDCLYVKGDFFTELTDIIVSLNLKMIGIESEHLSLSSYQQLQEACKKAGSEIQIIPGKGIVESIRAVKTDDEISHIHNACNLADKAVEHAATIIKPGITEKQLAWELEKYLRQIGSDTLPFEIIVASGPNSALPHARPTDREILSSEPIIIDLGARVNGYCSDITHTFIIGAEDTHFINIYNVVLAAQNMALSLTKVGNDAVLPDKAARSIINEAGYADYFGHGLGHGIGLDPHESPRLGPNSKDILMDGMAFTVEPGIYLPGWGGIRIEDTVAIINGVTTRLTNANKIARIEGGNIS